MPNNKKSYIWAANDFSEEQVQLEKLCARFKTEEIAEDFRIAFEKAKTLVESFKQVRISFSCLENVYPPEAPTVLSIIQAQTRA